MEAAASSCIAIGWDSHWASTEEGIIAELEGKILVLVERKS
jgi:hypothetical protein